MSSGLPASTVVPERLELKTAAREVEIAWGDGHISRYSFRYLRGFCPCAVCQGHSGGWDFIADVACDLEDVLEVGHYALNFVWKKSESEAPHRTGLYPFETLRLLCPCASCVEAEGEAHPLCKLSTEQRAQL